MPGQESSQEKTEQPTPKRFRDARKKGQVYKSRDLDSAVILLSAFAAIAFSRSFIYSELESFMKSVFETVALGAVSTEEAFRLAQMSLLTIVRVCAPVILTAFLTSALVGFLQVGPVFSVEPLKPQTKRLNAIENLKNMFKPKTLAELGKTVLKVVVVFLIAYSVIKGMLEPFLLTVTVPIEGATKVGSIILVRFLIRIIIVFLIVAALDLFIQRHEYIKNLKMTKDEVKREYKEDEGDPLIKSQRKQIHMEMAMGDVQQQVKNADVVVTNPTHLAIAIKYDKAEMVAPQIVAKGQRLFAEYIRDLAEENQVPIVRNIPLAWSLIELEIGDEIPETLFVAVAEILAFVYRLREERL